MVHLTLWVLCSYRTSFGFCVSHIFTLPSSAPLQHNISDPLTQPSMTAVTFSMCSPHVARYSGGSVEASSITTSCLLARTSNPSLFVSMGWLKYHWGEGGSISSAISDSQKYLTSCNLCLISTKSSLGSCKPYYSGPARFTHVFRTKTDVKV